MPPDNARAAKCNHGTSTRRVSYYQRTTSPVGALYNEKNVNSNELLVDNNLPLRRSLSYKTL